MKIGTVITMSILAATVQLVPLGFCQSPVEAGKNMKPHRPDPLANLSVQERQKFEAAREKAMRDPAVQSARDKMRQAGREFHEAMRAAMLKNDPTLKSTLDKLPPPPEREGPPPDRN